MINPRLIDIAQKRRGPEAPILRDNISDILLYGNMCSTLIRGLLSSQLGDKADITGNSPFFEKGVNLSPSTSYIPRQEVYPQLESVNLKDISLDDLKIGLQEGLTREAYRFRTPLGLFKPFLTFGRTNDEAEALILGEGGLIRNSSVGKIIGTDYITFNKSDYIIPKIDLFNAVSNANGIRFYKLFSQTPEKVISGFHLSDKAKNLVSGYINRIKNSDPQNAKELEEVLENA